MRVHANPGHMVMALSAVCRHVDVSSQQGNEEEIGTAMSEVFSDWLVNRPDVWVTGKFWPEGAECPTPAQIREQLKQTLQALKLEYLDLFLLPANKNEKAFKVWRLFDPPRCSCSQLNLLCSCWSSEREYIGM